jgi:gamma-glutamyltranspeptidase/glutathione hydrolase
MARALQRFGTVSWSDALQPAIRFAGEGFAVPPSLWMLWNLPGAPGQISMRERLAFTEASRAIYIKPNGETWRPGERFLNPDYARTLDRLADAGPQDFYTGALSREIVADLERNDALVTAGDLASYEVRELAPLSIDYRGHQVTSNPPAGGGICSAEILKIVEHEDLAALGHNSTDYIDLVAHAMKAAYADWFGMVGDPAFVDVPVGRLLSQDNADVWYDRIKHGETFTVPRYPEAPHTTHITVIDDAGNCASITHSLGSSGGVVTPGLGFSYNNNMNAANPQPGRPNSIASGKGRITGMCPTIVLRDGQPILALGAPGGTRIITGVTQVILNILDHGMSAVEAVSAARFDCQGDILDCEARIPGWVKDELAGRGFQVNANPASYGNFARVQAIARDPLTGELRGGSDPRGAGGAVMAV